MQSIHLIMSNTLDTNGYLWENVEKWKVWEAITIFFCNLDISLNDIDISVKDIKRKYIKMI